MLYVETTGLRGVGARDLPRLLRRVRRGIAGRHVGLPTLWVFSPLVLPFHRSALARRLNRILLRDAVHGQARDLGLKNPLLLISIPTAASIDLLGHLDEAAAIYDCMDDLTVIPLVDRDDFERNDPRAPVHVVGCMGVTLKGTTCDGHVLACYQPQVVPAHAESSGTCHSIGVCTASLSR